MSSKMAFSGCFFIILSIALILCQLLLVSLDARSINSRKITLKFQETSGKFSFDDYSSGDIIAIGELVNAINETGWAYLQVSTGAEFPDYVQAYAAGLVEGDLTSDLVKMQWTNTMAGYCPQPYTKYCTRLRAFIQDNLNWLKQQIDSDKKSWLRQPFWHQVELFLYQAAGLSDGVLGISRAPHMDIDPFGLYMFQVDGDFGDLESVLGADIQKPLGSGSCSALVKLLPGNKDLYVAQDTWTEYEQMLRILKVYDFAWKTIENGTVTIPGRIQSFSSYPGTLMSGDDFYLLSSGLVTMETTIGNSNPGLWKYVNSSTVLEGIRGVVANRLATSGLEWASTFALHNSGTYNNEWMVVDFKRFKPGMTALVAGTLTVLDQIPGTVKTEDLTELLVSQGYFPSYNVPYFPDIFNASGCQDNVKKYGDWFTYDKTPRAQIFRRDHVKVTDLNSMTRLMRYNDFTHDPLSRCNCSPPYSGENAISARSDLNPADGTYPFGALGHRLHGGVDMKLTSWNLFQDLSFIAVGGPTWDQQPPFQWSASDFNTTVHLGQPDLWNFDPIVFNTTAIFGQL